MPFGYPQQVQHRHNFWWDFSGGVLITLLNRPFQVLFLLRPKTWWWVYSQTFYQKG